MAVLLNADEVNITLIDKREFEATLIALDTLEDIVVLKMQSDSVFSVFQIANSKDSKAGDWVLAIASPFGFEKTVTKSIISSKSSFLEKNRYMLFIQNDAAVNPGTPGDPLFNIKGER